MLDRNTYSRATVPEPSAFEVEMAIEIKKTQITIDHIPA